MKSWRSKKQENHQGREETRYIPWHSNVTGTSKKIWRISRYIVAWRLRAGTAEPEEMATATQRITRPRVVRQINMITSPSGPGSKNECAGEGQQQFNWTEKSYRTGGVGLTTQSEWWDRKILSWAPRDPEPRTAVSETEPDRDRESWVEVGSCS
jgi:hypothetical protein